MSRYTNGGTTASNQSPEAVLQSGLAVCAGYAGLVRSLCELAAVECVSISGAAAAPFRPGLVPLGVGARFSFVCSPSRIPPPPPPPPPPPAPP
eukprot:SAG11_NODE_19155_length_473_cov_0.826203_1_plen_92_part_10